jgi:hypothetical protein
VRFFLDTEVNGFRGELISLALVSEWQPVPTAPGEKFAHEFYAARHIKSPCNDWVREHVLPVLRTTMRPPVGFKAAFQDFVVRYPDCEVICDWHTDAEYFCELLAGHDYGSSLDFPCTVRILKTPKEGGPTSVTPHNALDDARGLRDWYQARSRVA